MRVCNLEFLMTNVAKFFLNLSLIDAQLKRPQNLNRNALEYDWTYYPDLEEVEDWMNKTAEKHSDVVTLVDIGTSIEGRPIRGMIIDFKKKEKPVMGVLEGTLHAREWITTVTLTWLANEFLNSKDKDVRFLAENVVWHIFPVTNPDGFVYTFTDVSFLVFINITSTIN